MGARKRPLAFMPDVVKNFGVDKNGQTLWVFFCPGCGYTHPYHVPRWQWNGSTEKPSFQPSLLVSPDVPENRCHLFLTDGEIRYCDDSHHSLKGKVVPAPPVSDWFE